MHKVLLKLHELNIIDYKLVSVKMISVQYNPEYSAFIHLHARQLLSATLFAIVEAAVDGFIMTDEEKHMAAHTTNIMSYLRVTGRFRKYPELDRPESIVPLVHTIYTIESMVKEGT